MEPFVPIPLLVSLICSALHNDMQIWQNMKVVLSREIWSNALFSACWKCLSSWKILFICLWRNPHSAVSFCLPPSLSSSPHSPSLHFFFASIRLLLQLFRPSFFRSSPRMYGSQYSREAIQSRALKSKSPPNEQPVLYYHALLRANCVSKSPKDSREKDLEGWNPS